jgi:hypothetical protein
MFAFHRCSCCRKVSRRSECLVEPEGLFGPELLCLRCGGLVRARLTLLGWVVTLGAAVVLCLAVSWLQGRV